MGKQLTALRIMRITVRAGTPRLVGILRVVKVDVLQASGASLVTGLGSHCDSAVIVPVDDDIVGPTDRQIIKESLQILRSVKGDGLLGVNGGDLVHVENLNVVAHSLRADDGEVVEHTDLTPG